MFLYNTTIITVLLSATYIFMLLSVLIGVDRPESVRVEFCLILGDRRFGCVPSSSNSGSVFTSELNVYFTFFVGIIRYLLFLFMNLIRIASVAANGDGRFPFSKIIIFILESIRFGFRLFFLVNNQMLKGEFQAVPIISHFAHCKRCLNKMVTECSVYGYKLPSLAS